MSALRQERLLRKLQNLRALAQDPTGNPNEAAAAAARMTEIMLQEGISEAELNTDPEGLGKHLVEGKGKSTPLWRMSLMNGLAMAVGVRALMVDKSAMMWLVGPDLVLAGLRYQYDRVAAEIERLQKQLIGEHMRSEIATSFCRGAALVVTNRAMEARESAVTKARHNNQEKALVHLGRTISDEEVSATLNLKSSIRSEAETKKPKNAAAFVAGMVAGKDIPLDGSPAALRAEKRYLAGAR